MTIKNPFTLISLRFFLGSTKLTRPVKVKCKIRILYHLQLSKTPRFLRQSINTRRLMPYVTHECCILLFRFFSRPPIPAYGGGMCREVVKLLNNKAEGWPQVTFVHPAGNHEIPKRRRRIRRTGGHIGSYTHASQPGDICRFIVLERY
eukprot:GEMP01102077.1.p1 GENE.GEMP01102077.1~~GEMP01102077.1.p1  ORF type:complete len:148 (-),score=0.59 GEMP01102077.1:205-648(-)